MTSSPTSKSRVIVLNGTSSVGKSSVAHALQSIASEPFLHVQMDAFMAMMPERIWSDPEGIAFDQRETDGHPIVDISTGPKFAAIMDGMRRAVAAMAQTGNNCIVDDVMLGAGDQQSYRQTVPADMLSFVALHAPLETIEAREKARGDRMLGLARGQIEHVHKGREYDLELDVGVISAADAAIQIAERFGLI